MADILDEFGGLDDDVLLGLDIDNIASPIAMKKTKKNMPVEVKETIYPYRAPGLIL